MTNKGNQKHRHFDKGNQKHRHFDRKCKVCKGKGVHIGKTRSAQCLYCKGKGYR